MIAEKLLLQVLIILMPILVISFLINIKSEKRLKEVFTLLLGVAAVFCIVFAFEERGLYWDLRNVVLLLAFLYVGPKAGWTLCGIIVTSRMFIDIEHLMIGTSVTVIKAVIFHIFFYQFKLKVQKWDRVLFSINLALWPSIIVISIVGLYANMVGSLEGQFVHYITHAIVFISTIVIATGFSTLLLEQWMERIRLQEEMRRAVKMNAISELAASIAHEVRNPLTVVKGFLQLMEKDEKGKKKEYFTIALSEMQRAEEIIDEYLNFAKPQFTSLQLLEVNKVAHEIVTLLTPYSLKENVNLSIEQADHAYVYADRNQFKQVLINLIKNAVEATSKNGKVTVHLKQEDKVMNLCIRDTGKGMSTDQLANVGTLFYSTKEKGTGLGTMVSLRIIEEMGGTLTFDSKENIGTEVSILLPLADKNAKKINGLHVS
ncbi:ATP-binding protein [Halalkalibacter krulwichiae]|uniref:histidine kinase n=1 Tax=Halalkalibacter krulwichiae TaxID=199441 RepID=A0A1X9M9W1_9BACI|nr:ATP-binding protein [Halalkalibacter krulwichiae]ARK28953.1 Sporulation kinase E [Halalkalibacter krulwichiae]